MRKSVLLSVFALLATLPSARAETLYFFAKANTLWNNAGNWFVPDPTHPGQFTFAGRWSEVYQ